jgi:Flp pilus assembly protein TadD
VALLLLLATAPYLGVLRNDFAYIYDDKAQIIDSPYVHSFHHLHETFTTSVWSYKSARDVTNYYRPMTTIGFLLCYQIFGPLAYGFHLASLLLHAGVTVLLFLIAGRIFQDRSVALAAAGLFALHPIHVESVAWISAVTDLQMTFFGLLSLWCFLCVVGPGGKRRPWAQLGMTASFVLALLSKEPALAVLILAVIYEHFYREDRAKTRWQDKLLRYGALGLVAIAYLVMRVHALGLLARHSEWYRLSRYETCLSAIALLGQYVFKLLWPAHLSAFYVFHPSSRLLEGPVLGGMAAIVLCLAAWGALWKQAHAASFGIVWLLLTLAPVLNAGWMGSYVLADRYFYLPSVGFCLTLGWAGATLWRAASRHRVGRLAAVAAAAVVAALCVLRIVTRVPDWRDDLTLVARSLSTEPDEFILHDALGDACWMRGEVAPAEREWKEALRIKPTFVRPLNSLGALCGKQRRYEEAVMYLERAILLDPAGADAHLNLGAVFAETGHLGQAEEQFRTAVTLAPLNFAGHNILGKLYLDAGRLDEAEQQFRQSEACDPNVAALDYLGYVYQRRGDNAAAEKAFRAALALNDADSRAHYNLGLIYAAAGRKAEAIQELQAALAGDPDNPEIRLAVEKLRP